MKRVFLGLAALLVLVACRHPQPIREEYQVSAEEAAACGDDIVLLEEMRRHAGYNDASWSRVETSLAECLRRYRDAKAKRARGEPANEDERWRAEWEQERRDRDAADAAARERAATALLAQANRAREEREREERAREAFARTPINAQRAWSALVCASRAKRAEARTRIAEEVKYANEGGGIVDQAAIYQQQLAMRFADKAGAEAGRQLAAIRRAALACSSSPVKMIAACHRSFEAPCDPGAAESYLSITRDRLNAVTAEMSSR